MTHLPVQPSAEGAPWPGRWYALSILLAANLLCYADRYVLSAVVPGLRQDIFSDPEQYAAPIKFLIQVMQPLLGSNPENAMIGLLNMAFMVTYMIGAPLFASLKWHRWYIVGFGLILWSIASGASGLATTFGALILTRCLVGVGEAAYGPIAPTLISDMFSPKVRAQAMSFFSIAMPIGSAIGFAVGGLLVASSLGWRWAFYLAVPPGLLIGLLCFWMRDPKHKQMSDARKPTWKERRAQIGVFLRNKSFAYNMWASTAMTFAMGGVAFWIPSYIIEYRGVGDPEFVNLLFGGILVVAGMGGALAGGWVSDRFNQRDQGAYMKTSALAMLGTLPCTIAMLYVPFPLAWVFLSLAVFFLFFNTGSIAAIITNVTAPAVRASAFALSIFVTHALGDVFSPFIIGAIADGTGGNMNIAFLAVSLAVAIAAALWWRGARYLAADSKHTLS